MALAYQKSSRQSVLREIQSMQHSDVDWSGGRTWAYVYHPGNEILELVRDAYLCAFEQNGLSSRAFPSLGRMEREVVATAVDLLHGPENATGSITSGGSESILLAVKAHRDRAREMKPWVTEPEMILPRTAHPAFDKAGHYLNVRPVRVEVDDDQRVDPAQVATAVTDSTILLVASAPSYPHGVIDPVSALSSLAVELDLPLHVDACVGGFLLPFVRRLGRAVPDFDFGLEGVSTISADLHKYGYAAKGASLILHRTKESFAHQCFSFDAWPGSTYAAPNLTGTRPGGSIAAAWAVLKYLGEEGYLELTRRAMETTDRLIEGIQALPGGYIVAEPAACLFAFGFDDIDLAALGGELTKRGWMLSLQDPPRCLHLSVSANHDLVVEEFLEDLEDALRMVRHGEATTGLRTGYN